MHKVPIPPERYFNLNSITGGLDYTITSLGHEIGLKTRYEKAVLKKYEIKIRKGNDFTMKSGFSLSGKNFFLDERITNRENWQSGFIAGFRSMACST